MEMLLAPQIFLAGAQICVHSESVSKIQKAMERIMSGRVDKTITFDEAVYVLTRAGFCHDGGKGSHQVYRHADGRKLVLPRHGKDLKPIYVRQIRELLRD